MSEATKHNAAPIEPVLEVNDIQGIVVPGFFKPHQTLLYLRIPDGRQPIDQFKKLISQILPFIATASETLADRREFRRLKRMKELRTGAKALVAIGFPYAGLRRLTPGATDISDEAFRRGLPARSA